MLTIIQTMTNDRFDVALCDAGEDREPEGYVAKVDGLWFPFNRDGSAIEFAGSTNPVMAGKLVIPGYIDRCVAMAEKFLASSQARLEEYRAAHPNHTAMIAGMERRIEGTKRQIAERDF